MKKFIVLVIYDVFLVILVLVRDLTQVVDEIAQQFLDDFLLGTDGFKLLL